MGYNPSKTTWLNPDIEYLIGDEIIEYDMSDAGFSLIKQFQLLPDYEIKRLAKLEKGFDRHKAIGILQRDNRAFSDALNEKFAEVRMVFVEMNHISDDRIISVKKDAFFTIGQVRRMKFGLVEFKPKNTYSSYIRLTDIQNMELYYNSTTLDVKGMGDSAVNRHRIYMIEFLRNLIDMIESHDEQAKRYMMQFVKSYKSMNLQDEYYLEFNNLSHLINPPYNYQHVLTPLVQIIQREMG